MLLTNEEFQTEISDLFNRTDLKFTVRTQTDGIPGWVPNPLVERPDTHSYSECRFGEWWIALSVYGEIGQVLVKRNKGKGWWDSRIGWGLIHDRDEWDRTLRWIRQEILVIEADDRLRIAMDACAGQPIDGLFIHQVADEHGIDREELARSLSMMNLAKRWRERSATEQEDGKAAWQQMKETTNGNA